MGPEVKESKDEEEFDVNGHLNNPITCMRAQHKAKKNAREQRKFYST